MSLSYTHQGPLVLIQVNHLYSFEHAEPISLVERDGFLEEDGGLLKVLYGDGDIYGAGHTVSLQVDVLLAVCPQQVGSQQGEPIGIQDGMTQGWEHC